MSVYEEMGYRSRKHYLKCLAVDFDVDLTTVIMLANMLGVEEDFDGLVTMLEDIGD